MTSQAIQVGGMGVLPSAQRRRSRPAVERSLPAIIRGAVVVVLLVLALCGMVATASLAVAGTTPPDGPQVGLDL